MTDHRNVVQEILKIKGRCKFDDSQIELFSRLSYVRQAYKERNPKDKELLRYFPIAVLACVEMYFRLAIKELIDSGEPFLSNSQYIMPKTNISFDVLKALHGQSITIGDIISHSIPISSLTHLAGHMDKLMGIAFLNEVSLIHNRWDAEVMKQPKQPILLEADNTLRYVARTFELRHIFCHETASNYAFEVEEIENCFEHSVLFLEAAQELITETLVPNYPLTQTDMNIASFEDYKKEKEHLYSLLSQVTSLLTDDMAAKFMEINKGWEAFLAASVEFEGLRFKGGQGSMRPTIENSAAAQLIKERSEQVTKLIDSLKNE